MWKNHVNQNYENRNELTEQVTLLLRASLLCLPQLLPHSTSLLHEAFKTHTSSCSLPVVDSCRKRIYPFLIVNIIEA